MTQVRGLYLLYMSEPGLSDTLSVFSTLITDINTHTHTDAHTPVTQTHTHHLHCRVCAKPTMWKQVAVLSAGICPSEESCREILHSRVGLGPPAGCRVTGSLHSSHPAGRPAQY